MGGDNYCYFAIWSSGVGETFEHHGDGSNTHTGLAAGDSAFIIFAEAAMKSEPGEGAFDDPAFLQQDEALGAGRACLDFQDHLAFVEPRDEAFFVVPAVAAGASEAGEGVGWHLVEQLASALAVGHVGGGDNNGDEQAEGID